MATGRASAWLGVGLLLAALAGRGGGTLSLVGFNVQVFGVSKMGKPGVVEALVDIITRHDLVVVQEIRDAGGTSAPGLLAAINAEVGDDPADRYGLVLSDRLGHSSSKEQYGYFYREGSLTPLDTFHFNDTDVGGFGAGTDVFSREPFLALWESTGGGGERFGTAPCHVTPDRVPEELAEMPAVYAAATDRWGAGITTILLGDFNADCSYLSASELAGLELYTSALYSWLVDSAADTTVSGTDCAYDRIVVAGELAGSVTAADASVLRFDLDLNLTTDLAAEVSDHYPVRVLVPWGNATGTGSSSAAGAIRCAELTVGRATFPRTAAGATAVGDCEPGYRTSGGAGPAMGIELLPLARCGGNGAWLTVDADRCDALEVWINELHYQNAGTDVGEAVELVGPAGLELAGWSVEAINGNNGAVYGRHTFGAADRLVAGGAAAGWGFAVATFVALQNGPDAVGLVTPAGNVLQLLSYGGSPFVVTNGAASGLTTVDIGATEASAAAAGGSLETTGGGGTGPTDFTFAWHASSTFGDVNSEQVLAAPAATTQLPMTATPSATVTAAPAQSPTSGAKPASDASGSDDDGAVVGGVVAAALVLLLSLLIAAYYKFRKETRSGGGESNRVAPMTPVMVIHRSNGDTPVAST